MAEKTFHQAMQFHGLIQKANESAKEPIPMERIEEAWREISPDTHVTEMRCTVRSLVAGAREIRRAEGQGYGASPTSL